MFVTAGVWKPSQQRPWRPLNRHTKRTMTASGSTVEPRGIRNYVIDPEVCRLIVGRAEPRRTELMSSDCSLMAYLRGEPKVRSVVRAPSVADDRRLHGERCRLIGDARPVSRTASSEVHIRHQIGMAGGFLPEPALFALSPKSL
jgi:hypothetical protein